MRVMFQRRSSPAAHAAAMAMAAEPALTANLEQAVAGLTVDATYPPVQVPSVRPAAGGPFFSLAQPLSVSTAQNVSTYLVRGTIPDVWYVISASAVSVHVVGATSPSLRSVTLCLTASTA